MPLNDALERWYARKQPEWLRSWWPALAAAALLLLVSLLIGYVNTGNILPPAGSKVSLLVALLARLRGSEAAIAVQWVAEPLAIILIALALRQRREILNLPADMRVALSLRDYKVYARRCLDGVEESLLLWALPFSGLLVYGTAWLLHYLGGNQSIVSLGLPLLAMLAFKAWLALFIMLLLLRHLPTALLAVYIIVCFLLWHAVHWSTWLISADGLLDAGIRLPAGYLGSIVEIVLVLIATALVFPLLANRRQEVLNAYGKLR